MKFVSLTITPINMKDLITIPNQQAGDELDNIISINSSDTSEEFDYDFDYDPNEMYYALNGGRN